MLPSGPLFNYISGSNNARQKLAMTAPVIQEPGPSQKLAMTAPVLQSGPLPGSDDTADFVVAFVLPAGVTAETAPVPVNSQVQIRTVPGSLTAALRFSGSGSEAAFERRNEGLQAALVLAGLTAVGPPRFARFDPPFKPWFLRRNEVLQDVQESPPTRASPAPDPGKAKWQGDPTPAAPLPVSLRNARNEPARQDPGAPGPVAQNPSAAHPGIRHRRPDCR